MRPARHCNFANCESLLLCTYATCSCADWQLQIHKIYVPANLDCLQRRYVALSRMHHHPHPSMQQPAGSRLKYNTLHCKHSSSSPETDCHTLPPKTSLLSSTMGLCPASARYLAVHNPANPAPAMTTVSGFSGLSANRNLSDRVAASWKVPDVSKFGLG